MLSKIFVNRYLNVLVAEIVLIFMAGVMSDKPIMSILFALGLIGIFGTIIAAIKKSRTSSILATISGGIAFIGGTLWIIPPVPEYLSLVAIVVAAFAYALFVFIAMLAIARDVFIKEEVTSNLIIGSICLYLLIGMFFAFIYGGMEGIDPRSFTFSEGPLDSVEDFSSYLYFSYTTLTTTGFGDMVPTTSFTRMFAVMEALIGPLYVAIMVARLVGMHMTQSRGEKRI